MVAVTGRNGRLSPEPVNALPELGAQLFRVGAIHDRRSAILHDAQLARIEPNVQRGGNVGSSAEHVRGVSMLEADGVEVEVG